MAISSILLDIVSLLILIGCVFYYAKKGFLSSIVSLVGTIAVFIVSKISAVRIAPWIFDNYFRPGINDKVAEAIKSQGALEIESLFGNFAMFIPKDMAKDLMDKIASSSIVPGDKLVASIVDNVIEPMVTPFIAAITFIFIFVLLCVLVSFLSRILTATKKLPIIGTANSALGAVTGALIGALYIVVVFIAVSAVLGIWGGLTAKNDLFTHSVVWNLLSNMGIKIM